MAGADVFNANSLIYTPQGATQNVSARSDNFGDLGVNKVFGDYSELNRNGNLYIATSATTSDAGIAGVVALPTTTSGRVLYNAAAAASGIVLEVLEIGVSLKSGTGGVGLTILAGLAGGVLATPLTANGSAMTCMSMLDGVTKDSTTFTDINKTVVQPVYHMLAPTFPTTATFGVGGGATASVKGMFYIRPQNVLDVSVLGPTGSSPVFFVSIVYAKIKRDLGTPQ